MKGKVAQSCPTLCDPMDCSLVGFSVHGNFQARVLEWVAISFLQGIFLTQGSNSGLLHCRQTQVQSLRQEDPLEEGMTTHSNMFAWRSPWTEELGGLQSIGS